MLRRSAIGVLLAAAARVRSLDRQFGDAHGAALLVDVRTRGLIAVHAAELAAGVLAPPGSTIKPFALAALLDTGKLGAEESFPCPGDLRIGARSLTCSHPRMAAPMRVRTALAYSCNCFVAHFAERFSAGELAASLTRAGLASRPGWFGDAEAAGEVRRADGREAAQLQSLGEGGVLATAAELALAYRGLALAAGQPRMEPILSGLEGAVEFGTAQRARVPEIAVAGKTGSVRAADGAFIAWFAGFAPSRAPRAVVAVMLQGRSGGADAAPIGGRILQWYLASGPARPGRG